MEIYKFNYQSSENNQGFENNSTLLIGEFELFHIGHMELFKKSKEISQKNKIGITIFVKLEKTQIIPIENKLRNLEEIGFDFVVIIEFNFEFKLIEADKFIDHIVHKYNVDNIVIGEDFRFGKNRLWGVDNLKEYFKNTFVCNIKKINNIKMSSSLISEMIATGEINLVNDFLLNPYNPNIKYENNNVIWEENVIKPHTGIYYIKIGIKGYWFHGLLHLSIKNNNKIIIVNYDQEILNNVYEIKVLEEGRIIINTRHDYIKEEDRLDCLEFFYNLQKNNI
ncbi:MAG: hypothetical protein KFW07_02740 [Mycoplasmataceae bacterium]|nr:hypothetical protein [Mycoplasmataceae bacterium]